MKRLPKKPSRLIRLALSDLKKVEKSDRYVVDMDNWHTPNDEDYPGKCSVCFAGSVMAKSLRADSFVARYPTDFPENTWQLKALDWLRVGYVGEALSELDIERPKGLRSTYRIPSYVSSAPAPFYRAMERLAARLEKAGV